MGYLSLERIGQKARERRKEQGLTQQAAGERAQLHRNDISEIERGCFRGSVVSFVRYLGSLGLDLDWTVRERPTLEELGELFPLEDDD